jgi:hypothetical protein
MKRYKKLSNEKEYKILQKTVRLGMILCTYMKKKSFSPAFNPLHATSQLDQLHILVFATTKEVSSMLIK